MTRPHSVEKRIFLRAGIILSLHSGMTQTLSSAKYSVSRTVAGKWKKRWKEKGPAGLSDLPGAGRGNRLFPGKEAEIVSLSRSPPGDGRKRRPQRETAKIVGVSAAVVNKVLKRQRLKPHRTDYRCGKSPDPEFREKAANITGFYMNPPENALVLCVDEKTQVQVLERSQPVLPGISGKPEKQSVTCFRHGTANLMAALETASGKITATSVDRNNSENFLKFLKKPYRKYPRGEIHVICDNLSVHKQKDVQKRVKTRKRLHMHYADICVPAESGRNLLFGNVATGTQRCGAEK